MRIKDRQYQNCDIIHAVKKKKNETLREPTSIHIDD